MQEFQIRISQDKKSYRMAVRQIKSTEQVQRFCVHAKDKEMYFEKRLLLKTGPWKITSTINCGIPDMETFNQIIGAIENYLKPKPPKSYNQKSW